MSDNGMKPVEVLLVEDNPGDVRLTMEAMKEAKILNNLSVASDGVEALAFLHHEGSFKNAARPDIILLDLNLPKKDGREVLAEIKQDKSLRQIPVVILTTSQAEEDIVRTYNTYANCFVTKPVDLDQFIHVVKTIGDFWFSMVKLPPGTYLLGCGIKNNAKAAYAWSDYRIQLLGSDRRRPGFRPAGTGPLPPG